MGLRPADVNHVLIIFSPLLLQNEEKVLFLGGMHEPSRG